MENEDTIPKVEEEEEDQLNLPSKKKKKKKKVKTLDLDAEPTEADDESKPTKVSFQVDENGDVDDDLALSGMKKKKKKDKRPIDVNEASVDGKDGDDKLWSGDRDYTYDELLTRAFQEMKQLNPDMEAGKKKKFIMKPPQCARVGTKKTSFVNFGEICGMLRRQPKHIVAFILAELGASGSVDGNSQLIIKGRFQQKQLESVLRKYIKEYVTCHTCRSPDTVLERDVRLYFLRCNVCKSRCSVAAIKSGFQAVTGKRARIRAKAGS